MSRSSKGFADFFPTAPSVLQRKRSRAAEERRDAVSASFGGDSPHHRQPANTRLAKSEARSDHFQASGLKGHPDPTSSLLIQEEGDSNQGDLLNGVGSASSSSTASSVFSASNRMLIPANQQGSNHSASWTPLTHVDASPSHDAMDSPSPNRSCKETIPAGHTKRPSTKGNDEKIFQSSRIKTDKPAKRLSARPPEGEVKGERLQYNPEDDLRLKRKENRKEFKVAKPVYVLFGQEVRLTSRRQFNTSCLFVCVP